MSYTPQVAGDGQNLVVTINGDPIFQTLSVDIAPADISAATSSVSVCACMSDELTAVQVDGIDGATGQAGVPFTFNITARDVYNNLIDDVVLDVAFTGNGTASGEAGVAAVGTVQDGGVYPVCLQAFVGAH